MFSLFRADVRAISHKKESYKRFQKEAQQYALAAYRGRTEFWLALSPRAFEHEVARVFQTIGYEVNVVGRRSDEGIDITMRRAGRDFIVQCKANKTVVGPKIVRELYGALNAVGAHHAFLATLRGCTKEAWGWAGGKPITIVTAQDFANAELEALARHAGPHYLPGSRLLWEEP
jgi:restriction system protein